MEDMAIEEPSRPPTPVQELAIDVVDTSQKVEEVYNIPGVDLPIKSFVQPKKDNQSGSLLNGPGAGVTVVNPRPNEMRRCLMILDAEMDANLNKARVYAMEQSVAYVLEKQKVQQMECITNPNMNNAQKQRVLAGMCRLYVGSISFDIKEDMVQSTFSAFGIIRKIDMSWDPTSMKHKGFCFVEYELPDAAQLAYEQMQNFFVSGRQIKIGRPFSLPQSAPMIEHLIKESKMGSRLYVSNIHPSIISDDLKKVFQAFGTVKDIDMPRDASGNHRGYAFVDYESPGAANDARTAINMFDIGGMYLRVGKALTQARSGSVDSEVPTATALAAAAVAAKLHTNELNSSRNSVVPAFSNKSSSNDSMNNLISAISSPAMIKAGLSGVAASLVSSAAFNPSFQEPSLPVESETVESQSSTTITSDHEATSSSKTDDHHEDRSSSKRREKKSKSSSKRTKISEEEPVVKPDEIILSPPKPVVEEKPVVESKELPTEQKLDEYITEESLDAEEGIAIRGTDARFNVMKRLAQNMQSNVVLLRNMVDANEIDNELEDEIREECQKYGPVKKVLIIKEQSSEQDDVDVVVKIFVEFVEHSGAENAKSALNGRWFAGRCVRAAIYDISRYRVQDYSG